MKVPADAELASTGPLQAVYTNEDGGGLPGVFKSSTIYFRSKTKQQDYLKQVQQDLTAMGYTVAPNVSGDQLKLLAPDKLIMVYVQYQESQDVFVIIVHQSEDGQPIEIP